jgi:hypothetical protein
MYKAPTSRTRYSHNKLRRTNTMIKREDADRMIDEIFESSKDNDDDEKE